MHGAVISFLYQIDHKGRPVVWFLEKNLLEKPYFILSTTSRCTTYRIISVHLIASCSSISLSLYWFLSIRTLAISTLVKRFLCAVGTSLCCNNTSMTPLFNAYTEYMGVMLIFAIYLDKYDGYEVFLWNNKGFIATKIVIFKDSWNRFKM